MSLGNSEIGPYVYQNKHSTQIQMIPAPNSVPEEPFKYLGWITYEPPPFSRLEYLFGYVRYAQRVSASLKWSKYGGIEKKYSQDKEGSWLQYRTLSWLTSQVWEIFNFKARNTWALNLRVYNVVPRDSLVFDFIQTDNIEGIKTLFSRKRPLHSTE
jgi:hypothetical protein